MKKYLFCILFVVSSIILYIFYPRNHSFTFVCKIHNESPIDYSQSTYYHYIHNKERLFFFMQGYYINRQWLLKGEFTGYNSSLVDSLANIFDFNRYDYIITYQKQIKNIRYSPFLTNTEDGLYFDKRTPLIIEYDTIITDSIYFYQVENNDKFRAPGP